MRVVAGSAKGRRLASPPGEGTRPTSDRVREAVFSSLVSLGVVEGATVVDLYAGSGAMGIEALSRGAAHATFVERDPGAVAAIRRNLVATGFEDRASVVRDDAVAWLTRAGRGALVDLALADPPYAFDGWAGLLEALPAAVAVLEAGREVDPGEGWVVLRRRRYGSTVVTIVRRGDGPA